MDAGGNNRYELLFMDDDGEGSAQAAVPKKPTGNVSVNIPKKPTTAKKPSKQAEKENKSGTLNKDQAWTKKVQIEQPKMSASTNRNKFQASAGTEQIGNRISTFKSEIERNREYRNNRRNLRDTELGVVSGADNSERQQRSFKDRENRPPRNRDFSSRSGKREFDRQSGSDKTGVKAVDKRDGAGAHNWGSVKQEIEDINVTNTDGIFTDKDDSANEQAGELITSHEEEEVKELTLDEWKAMRQQREKPKYNIRKPGEGEDTAQWKKMVVLNKKKENGSEEELEYDPSLYPQRVGRLQRIVDIQFNFNDGRRGGGNFGGRGGRGTRRLGGGDKSRFESNKGNNTNDIASGPVKVNRDKPRNFGEKPRSANSGLKVDYESQFPTLR